MSRATILLHVDIHVGNPIWPELQGCCYNHDRAASRIDRRARNDLNEALAARSVARYARYWTKDAVVWSEGLKSGGVGTYRGRYLIMWLKTDGQWKIRSELYVETHCSGDPDCK